MNNGKRFSICLTNPPYDKSLHLKFLEKVIEISDQVVSVQPIRWIKDPVASKKKNSAYNKYKTTIIDHIKDIETYDSTEAMKIFDISLNTDIGIFYCNINHTDGCELPVSMNENILEKVLKTPHKLSDVIEHNKIDGWRWYVIDIQPILAQGGGKYSYGWFCRFCIYNHLRSLVYKDGYDKNGKFWTELNSGIKRKIGTPFWSSISFKTENEAINFENSLKTTFYHYLVYNIKTDQHTPLQFLPFMDDYTQPWTNERFYQYYKFDKSEINEIESQMKDIENDAKEYLKNKSKKK